MFFLIVLLIVQIGFLVLARNVAATSVDAALRRAVAEGTPIETLRNGLVRDVYAVVPGADDVSVGITRDVTSLRAVVRFKWIPPGPDLIPVNVAIDRRTSTAVPP